MKLVRYKTDKPEYRGILDGDKVRRINGSFFLNYGLSEEICHISDVTFLPPVLSGKIIGLRANYDKNINAPLCFMKPRSSLCAHQDKIILPANLEKVKIEGELAVVIGKKCRHVEEHHVGNYILGYTISNDITGFSPDFQESFTCGKWFDTFTPIGPAIDTTCSWQNLEISTRINGKTVQQGNTSQMTFKVPYIISYLSSIITLEPGDVILTGTPSAAVEIHDGDEIEIEIEKLGILKNTAEKEIDK